MAVTEQAPRELLAVAYTVGGTSTSTATNGAALSTPWGGTFTIAHRTSVDILLSVPFATLSVGSAISFLQICLMVDGVVKQKLFKLSEVANIDAYSGMLTCRVTGLAAGSHTVAVQLQVSSGTGTVAGAADSPGMLIVREV